MIFSILERGSIVAQGDSSKITKELVEKISYSLKA